MYVVGAAGSVLNREVSSIQGVLYWEVLLYTAAKNVYVCVCYVCSALPNMYVCFATRRLMSILYISFQGISGCCDDSRHVGLRRRIRAAAMVFT